MEISSILKITLLFVLFLFSACGEPVSDVKYDANKLLEQKCASCHNLNMPPILSKDELAPPMMAVSFHVRSFVEPKNESQRTSKAVAFVVDYIQNPSLEKSFCDKESIKRYGLMPSQKENVTTGEAKAIATYMFSHFTQENLTKIQAETAAYNARPEGERLALKHHCLGCHKMLLDTVGPSFINIAKKYKNDRFEMIQSIQNGSTKKWKEKSGAVMPAFKKLNDKELQILADWILKSRDKLK